MKVIVKSNEYIAIPTKRKSDCLYQLGQYLNKETCQVEMDKDEIRSITCLKKGEKGYSKLIKLETQELSWGDKYIILDKEGNLVNVVEANQFNDYYAILQDNKEL